jgi:methionine-rich copper-binding protein CopC
MRKIARYATCLTLASGPALGHAMLEAATPPVGSIMAAAPSELTLRFSEAMEPAFSKIAVTAPDGARVDKNDLHAAPNDPATIVIGLAPLKPGSYHVVWHGVSADTHKTQGSFRFTVRP